MSYPAAAHPSEVTPLLGVNSDGTTKDIPLPKSRDRSPRKRPHTPWSSYFWDYDPGRSHEEHVFIRKLDTYLLTMLSFGYFIKNLNQTNISNAFVSGMKEDLAMHGDQLNLVDTAFTVGYVIGQIPSQIILTKVRPSIWVPSCELTWALLTLCIASAKSSSQVITIRFFVGLAESTFFPAAHTILGSWYKPSELGKRACVFHASSAVASILSGYLQAGIYTGLNRRGGLAGWQWLFVIDVIISLPICLCGFFIIPDLPENTKAFYLTEKDRDLANERMWSIGRAPRTKLGYSALKRIFGRWHIYILSILYIIFVNIGPSSSVNPMSLWLKAKGASIKEINIIPTGTYAIQLILTLAFAILSDAIRQRATVMTMATLLGGFAALSLAIWDIPEGLKWTAFFMQRTGIPYGPLSMSWANEICGADAEERAIVIGTMNSLAFAFHAWIPLLTYPQTDSPRFKKGFIYSTAAFGAQGIITVVVAYMYKRDRDQKKGVEIVPDIDAVALDEEGAVASDHFSIPAQDLFRD